MEEKAKRGLNWTQNTPFEGWGGFSSRRSPSHGNADQRGEERYRHSEGLSPRFTEVCSPKCTSAVSQSVKQSIRTLVRQNESQKQLVIRLQQQLEDFAVFLRSIFCELFPSLETGLPQDLQPQQFIAYFKEGIRIETTKMQRLMQQVQKSIILNRKQEIINETKEKTIFSLKEEGITKRATVKKTSEGVKSVRTQSNKSESGGSNSKSEKEDINSDSDKIGILTLPLSERIIQILEAVGDVVKQKVQLNKKLKEKEDKLIVLERNIVRWKKSVENMEVKFAEKDSDCQRLRLMLNANRETIEELKHREERLSLKLNLITNSVEV